MEEPPGEAAGQSLGSGTHQKPWLPEACRDQISLLASFPGARGADISQVCKGNGGASSSRSFSQVHNVFMEALASVDAPFHSEVKVSAAEANRCCKEFKNTFLLYLQDSRAQDKMKVSLYYRKPRQCLFRPLSA